MANWKTSLAGLVAALAVASKSMWPEFSAIADAVAGLALALLGYFASDKKA